MRSLIVSLVLCLGLGCVAAADPLTVVTISYPPYQYEEDGQVDGAATRVVREVFERMDVAVSIRLLTWVEALEQVKTGEADAIYTAFRTEEREAFLAYPKVELVGQTTSLFVRAGSVIDYSGDLSQLDGYSFGVVEGVSYGPLFDEAVRSGVVNNLVVSSTEGMSLLRFLDGEFDILVSNWLQTKTLLKLMNRADAAYELLPPLQNIKSYLAFSKKSKHIDLLPQFEKTLRDVREDGTFGKIFQQF